MWVNDFNFCINSQICQHFLGSLRPAIEPKFRCVIFPLLGCAFVFCAGRPGGMRDTLKTSADRPTLNLRKKALLEEGLLVAPVSRQVLCPSHELARLFTIAQPNY